MCVEVCSRKHVIDLLSFYNLIVIFIDEIESNMQVLRIDQFSTIIGSHCELFIIDLAVMINVDCIEGCVPVRTVPSQLITQQ